MELLEEWTGALQEIAHVWTSPRSISVQWDTHRQRWTGPRGTETYPVLDGERWTPNRLAHYARHPREAWSAIAPGRWADRTSAPAPLPKDAVLIPANNGGLVCASAQEGVSLKLVPEGGLIEREVKAWHVARQAGIDAHVPTLLDHGSAENGVKWMTAQLAPNTRPVGKPFDPTLNRGRRWRQWLRDRILPVLSRFYDASGVEIRSIADVLEDRRTQLQKWAHLEPLQHVYHLAVKAASQAAGTQVATAMVHGDLHSEHLHRHDGKWWLIDWGGARHTCVACEIFIEYYRCRFRNNQTTPFYRWLSGETSYDQLPRGLRADIDLYLTWQREWKGIRHDKKLLRSTLLSWILKRMILKVKESKNLESVISGEKGVDELEKGWYGWVIEEVKALGAMNV